MANAEDRKTLKKLDKMERFRERQLLSDLQRVLEQPEGQRLFGHLLAMSRLYGHVFAPAVTDQTLFNLGYQQFGRDLADLMNRAERDIDLRCLALMRAEERKFEDVADGDDRDDTGDTD